MLNDSHSHHENPTVVYVCLCYGITERQVREAAAAGCETLPELTARTGCGGGCGCCAELARQILAETRAERPFPLPMMAAA